jgi:glutathione peroxidase
MLYKNNLLILLILSMFTFFEKVDAKYEKLFFDHSIKNINNENIDLNQYK